MLGLRRFPGRLLGSLPEYSRRGRSSSDFGLMYVMRLNATRSAALSPNLAQFMPWEGARKGDVLACLRIGYSAYPPAESASGPHSVGHNEGTSPSKIMSFLAVSGLQRASSRAC